MFNKMKSKFTMLLALLLTITMLPQGNAYAFNEDDYYSHYSEDIEPVDPAVFMGDLINEAKELGVPSAFYRHFLGNEYEDGSLLEPVTDLEEGEAEPKYTMAKLTTSEKEDGLVISKIDTGVLARTKFDLGKYDFGELKAGRLVYNMIAKRTLKGMAYLYLDNEEEPFVSFKIKRCVNDDWEKTINKVVDVRDVQLEGEHEIYLKFIADSALDEENNIKPTSGVKGNLFLGSIFFTEASTPVVDFSLDNEINTIDKVNGSELHTIMACGDMNIQIPEGYESEFSNEPVTSETYEMEYIKGRGNSTWLVDKKPYKIKLDKSSDLFGMGKSKHWVLLANYYDYSLIRNRMTFDLGRQMGMEYTPKSVCVDVIMDGEYYGSYQLCQHVRIGKGNINIDDIEDLQPTTMPEISGGYLLSMGTSWLAEDEDVPWLETREGSFRIEKPEYDANYSEESKSAQMNYLNGYFKDLEDLIYSTSGEEIDNPGLEGKNWRDYMDEQSYIDHYLFQEFSQNGDAFGSGSTYLYKKRNGKLYWGPLWDFDFVAWAAYETNYISEEGVDGFSFEGQNPWFTTLIKNDPEFKQRVLERWDVFKGYLEAAIADGGLLDKYKQQTYYSALANYQVRGSYLMGAEAYWGGAVHLVDDDGEPYTLNYTNEIERLKKFIRARIDWVDENIENIENESDYNDEVLPVKFYVDDEVVAEVHADWDNDCLKQDEIPENPQKDGMYFQGWYYIDDEGDEVKYSRTDMPYYYDEDTDNLLPYEVYAKFKPKEEIKPISSISFSRTRLYVPISVYYDSYDGEENIGEDTIDLNDYLNVLPLDADYDNLEWYKKDESNSWVLYDDGTLTVNSIGECTIYCKAGDKTASIRVYGFDSEDEEYVSIDNVRVENEIEIKLGEARKIEYGFNITSYVPYYAYNGFTFKSLDENIATVNNLGMVEAKAAGETTILTICQIDDEVDVKITKVKISGQEETTTGKDDSGKDEPKKETLKVGDTFTDGTYIYKVTKAGSLDGKTIGEASVVGLKNKSVSTIKIASKITYDNVPYNITSVGAKAFAKNKKIKTATIGKNVVSIGASAFAKCSKLKKVSIASTKLRQIGAKAFYLDNKLTKATISSTKLKKIGKYAFRRKKCKTLVIKVKKNKRKAYKKKLKKAKTNKYKVK